jgi:hypothetical protein
MVGHRPDWVPQRHFGDTLGHDPDHLAWVVVELGVVGPVAEPRPSLIIAAGAPSPKKSMNLLSDIERAAAWRSSGGAGSPVARQLALLGCGRRQEGHHIVLWALGGAARRASVPAPAPHLAVSARSADQPTPAHAHRRMDLGAGLYRRTGVRRTLTLVAVVLAAGAVAAAAAADTAGGDRSVRRVSVPGRLSIRVPADWHVLHGWLSDVTDPAPRLAVASFPVRLSRHSCACGFPNVIGFPRGGAFLFVWQYLHPSRRALARTPRRPTHFRVTAGRVRQTCNGPGDGFDFKDAGRVFQVEVYVGPDARPALRAQLATLLDSLRVTGGDAR